VRVVRNEIIGKEGGCPPILLEFSDAETGEVVGVYSKTASGDGMASGPMFEEKP
jgi:hypothetical protein